MSGPRLVLLGAPASGKGTQAGLLVERLSIPKISTGDMLRAARASGSELGQRVAAIMDAGELVSDEVVLELVRERLAAEDAQGGFILDGFPRTVPQAEALESGLAGTQRELTAVVLLDVPREALMERATLRRTDVKTGQIYHLKYSPPPPGAELEHRQDDQPDTVSRRLDAYDKMTAALVPFYERRGLLRRIDGVGEPKVVSERLAAALSGASGSAGHG